MNDEALKACPFCGLPAEFLDSLATENGRVFLNHDTGCIVNIARYFATKDEAIAAWNTRADLAAPVKAEAENDLTTAKSYVQKIINTGFVVQYDGNFNAQLEHVLISLIQSTRDKTHRPAEKPVDDAELKEAFQEFVDLLTDNHSLRGTRHFERLKRAVDAATSRGNVEVTVNEMTPEQYEHYFSCARDYSSFMKSFPNGLRIVKENPNDK